MRFKQFVEDDVVVRLVEQAFDLGVRKPKPKRETILDTWRQIKPDLPIYITPIQDTPSSPGDNSTYGEDGVRITGSWAFIASILGRIKDLLAYENPQTKLRLMFRGVNRGKATADRQAYAFYVNLERNTTTS